MLTANTLLAAALSLPFILLAIFNESFTRRFREPLDRRTWLIDGLSETLPHSAVLLV